MTMQENDQITIVYTTIAAKEEAIKLAEQAIKLQHAACVNILPGAISVYQWQGKMERAEEYVIIFKTSIEKSPILKAWILENHPYTVPAMLSSNVSSSPAFWQYVHDETVGS